MPMIRSPIPSLDGHFTERLRFRAATMDDAGWWMAYIQDARSIRFMPFTLGSAADCTLFIRRSMDRYAADGSGLHAIVERNTGVPAGMVGLLTQLVDDEPELEIGYYLVPSATGQGYATKAAIACKHFAQTHSLAPSVISLIDPRNFASQAVARRNGMVHEKDTIHRGMPAMVWRVVF